jgi:hypothetical protein
MSQLVCDVGVASPSVKTARVIAPPLIQASDLEAFVDPL